MTRKSAVLNSLCIKKVWTSYS